MIFHRSLSGVICHIVFHIHRLAISAIHFLVVFDHFWICKICSSSTCYRNLLHNYYRLTKKLQNYKNYTACQETIGRAINHPHYFWKKLFAREIYRLHTKYSLKRSAVYASNLFIKFMLYATYKPLLQLSVHLLRIEY